jgi:hypothetical protein
MNNCKGRAQDVENSFYCVEEMNVVLAYMIKYEKCHGQVQKEVKAINLASLTNVKLEFIFHHFQICSDKYPK